VADKEGKYEAIVIDDEDEIELEDDEDHDDLDQHGASSRSGAASSAASKGRGGSSRGGRDGRSREQRSGKGGTTSLASSTVAVSEVNALLGSSSSFSDLGPLLDFSKASSSSSGSRSAQAGSKGNSGSSSNSSSAGRGASGRGGTTTSSNQGQSQESAAAWDSDYDFEDMDEDGRQNSSNRTGGGRKQQAGSTVPIFVSKALAQLEQLEKGGKKGGAGKAVGTGGPKGQGQVARGKGLSGNAMTELQRELQELKAEKGKLRDARVQAKQQKQ
jgi:hypothetical protein